MGAQVPRAAFACISKLSDALSVRGDKRYAMHCRKKPRDALSVRTTGKGLAQIVTTEMIATTGSRWGTREKAAQARREQAWDGSTARFRSTSWVWCPRNLRTEPALMNEV